MSYKSPIFFESEIDEPMEGKSRDLNPIYNLSYR